MINFFTQECQELTSATKFGLCDDEDKLVAYISLDENADKWIAKVTNPNVKEVVFIAIDNCIPIYKRENPTQLESRIDVILTYDDEILFIELKDKRADWITDGIQQLATTIEIFSENHNLKGFRKRRTFLANRKKPQFQFSQKQRMQQFRNKLGVRLIIHNEILV